MRIIHECFKSRKQNEMAENSDKRQLAIPTVTTPKIHYEVKFHNQSDQHNRIKWHLLVLKYVYLIMIHLGLYASCFYNFFQFKMKVPKGNEMKRYVILFCVVLVFIVLSTALAGYVSTMNIPNEIDQKFKKMPQWDILNSLPSNLTEMKTAFKLIGNFAYKINKFHGW